MVGEMRRILQVEPSTGDPYPVYCGSDLSQVWQPRWRRAVLIADRNTTKPVLDVMDIGAEKGRGFSRTELPIWEQRIPIRVHGMLLSREHLYLAGAPDLAPDEGAYEAMIGKRGALFRVVSRADGSTLAEFEMNEAPIFDGLIAAGGKLYMTTMEGTLVCFGGKGLER